MTQELCLLSNLTSSEWASWVQAIGSIAAIIGAIFIAGWQTRRQHLDALRLMAEEKRQSRLELARTLLVLSRNSLSALNHLTDSMKDREAVHVIGEGGVHYDIEQIRRIDTSLAAIPLHDLPSSLVTHTMVVSATVRQYREKVEQVLRVHRTMDGAEFSDFFECRRKMSESLDRTCNDIANEIEKLNLVAGAAQQPHAAIGSR